MKLKQIDRPAIEPVTIAEIKRHLRLDDTRGEPSPVAPTVAISATTSGNLSAGVYRYRLTFVTATGETEGGLISSAITADATHKKAAISDIPIGGSPVIARKIYRTMADGTNYLLLTTLNDDTTVTYIDNVANASLGVACPSVNTTDDPELLGFIKTARRIFEDLTGCALITQTFELRLNRFPPDNFHDIIPNKRPFIYLPVNPVQSVDDITYIDTTGHAQTWPIENFIVTDPGDGEIAYITPGYDSNNKKQYYPTVRAQQDAIVIEFTAGYGDSASDCPPEALTAIKMLAAHLYENRGIIGPQQMEIPMGVKTIIANAKYHWWGGENQGL